MKNNEDPKFTSLIFLLAFSALLAPSVASQSDMLYQQHLAICHYVTSVPLGSNGPGKLQGPP